MPRFALIILSLFVVTMVTLSPVSAQPDAGLITFVSNRDSPWGEIYYVNAAGGDICRLTYNTNADTLPAWSPDGQRLAFVSNQDGDSEIFVMNIDGRDRRQITNNTDGDSMPVWSPDGRWIAFVSNRDGNSDLYLVSVEDPARFVRLTNDIGENYADTHPAWSPSGGQIAFVSSRPRDAADTDSDDEIYIIDVLGLDQDALSVSPPRPITDNAVDDHSPAWSPNGRYLAYVSPDGDEDNEVYVAEVGAGSLLKLTDNLVDDAWPSWSPDGRRLVYASRQDDVWNIFTANADGSDQRQHTFSVFDQNADRPTQNWSPNWAPARVVGDSLPDLIVGLRLIDTTFSDVQGQVIDFADPQPVDIGSMFAIEICNVGTADPGAVSYTVDLTLSADELLLPGTLAASASFQDDMLMGQFTHAGGMLPGQAVYVTLLPQTFIPQSAVDRGRICVGALADSANAIREGYEDNNTFCQMLRFPSPLVECPGSLPPRLRSGMRGEIAERFSTLRHIPAANSGDVIYSPAQFTVLEGPVCAGYETLTWYRIQYDDGRVGWASESQRSSEWGPDLYWLKPLDN